MLRFEPDKSPQVGIATGTPTLRPIGRWVFIGTNRLVPE